MKQSVLVASILCLVAATTIGTVQAVSTVSTLANISLSHGSVRFGISGVNGCSYCYFNEHGIIRWHQVNATAWTFTLNMTGTPRNVNATGTLGFGA